jgi:hypothetical protein
VDSKAEEKKADDEEKRSTSSRAGTPTIWEKFQILGTQYTAEAVESRSLYIIQTNYIF